MTIYAFVFARGGSKGIPRKNLKTLKGKPLLAYSIDMAKEMEEIDKVFVSTDDEEIARTAHEWGAEVIDRPVELARDDSPEWLAWQHAVKYVNAKYGDFDIFVCLPTTAPLRSKDDVRACILALTDKVDIVVTVFEAGNNPYFNMVTIDGDGNACILNDSQEKYSRRQDAPKAYNMTTVAYVSTTDFVLKGKRIFDGVVKPVEIPQERAIDIDTPVDFEIAKCLMEKC